MAVPRTVPVDDLPDGITPNNAVPSDDLPDDVKPSVSTGQIVGEELSPNGVGKSLLGKSTHPAIRALEAVKGLLELPAKTGQMMNEGSDILAGNTAEYLGSKGVPDALSATLGMIVNVLSNPLNYPTMGMDTPSGVLLDPNKEAQKVSEDFSRYGITPTPAQLTQGQLAQRIETLGNRYPYSAQNFQDFYTKQMADADNIRATLLNTVGENDATKTVSNMLKTRITKYLENASPEDAAVLKDKFGDLDSYMQNASAGQFGQGMLAQASKIAHDKADEMYTNLPIQPNTSIPTPKFSALAKKLLDDELQANPVDRNKSWIKRLSSYANVQNVPGLDLGESVTGDEAGKLQQAIQSALGEQTAQMPFAGTQMAMKSLRDLRIQNDPGYLLNASGQGNRFSGYAAKLRQALASDIQNGVNSVSPEAGEMLKQANSNYAQFKQIFNDPYIVGLLKNDPEEFMNRAIKPKDITNISLLKNVIGDENFLPVKQNFLASMLVDKDGRLSPSGFLSNVKKFGMPTLSSVFNPDELAEITNAQRVFQAMGAAEKATGNPSGTAGIMMAKQAVMSAPTDAILTLLGGLVGHPVGGFGVAMAKDYVFPKLIAKAYLSKPVRDLLINGITAPDSAMMALGVLGKSAMIDANQRAGRLSTGTTTQQ